MDFTQKNFNEKMTTTPAKPVNLVTGPRSAFARLFPEKYRQQELIKRQHLHTNQMHIECTTTDSDDDNGILNNKNNNNNNNYNYNNDNNHKKQLTKSSRVQFHTRHDDDVYRNHTKSEPYLNRIHQLPDYTKSTSNSYKHANKIRRDCSDDLIYTQTVGIRFLRPPTPPSPGPLVIREVQSTTSLDSSSLIVSTTQPTPPRTPSPIIVREQPPVPPEYQPTEIITKTIPSTSTRRVVVKRMLPLPAKPRPVIIEKWLPYKQVKERPVLYQRTEQIRSTGRNLILQYEPARVEVKQKLENFGCFRVDPKLYQAQYGPSLRRTESVRKVLEDIGLGAELMTSIEYDPYYSSRSFQANHHLPKSDYRQQTRIDMAIPVTKQLTPTENHYDIPRSCTDHDANIISIV